MAVAQERKNHHAGELRASGSIAQPTLEAAYQPSQTTRRPDPDHAARLVEDRSREALGEAIPVRIGLAALRQQLVKTCARRAVPDPMVGGNEERVHLGICW